MIDVENIITKARSRMSSTRTQQHSRHHGKKKRVHISIDSKHNNNNRSSTLMQTTHTTQQDNRNNDNKSSRVRPSKVDMHKDFPLWLKQQKAYWKHLRARKRSRQDKQARRDRGLHVAAYDLFIHV